MGNEIKPKKESFFKRLFSKKKTAEVPVEEQNNIAGEVVEENLQQYNPNDFVMLEKNEDMTITQNIPVNSLSNDIEETLDVEPVAIQNDNAVVSEPQVQVQQQPLTQETPVQQPVAEQNVQVQPESFVFEQPVQNEFVNTEQNVEAQVIPIGLEQQVAVEQQPVVNNVQPDQVVNPNIQQNIDEQPIYQEEQTQGRSM